MTSAATHSLNEPIVIHRTDGGYRLVATESGLASEGEDLAAAYADLQQIIIEEAPNRPVRGEMDREPRSLERGAPAVAGMTRLLQAALLMLILSVLPLMFFAASALNNAANLLGQIRSVAAFVAPTKSGDKVVSAARAQEKRRVIVQELHSIAQDARALTPERKQEVLEDVRAIVGAAQPFADAIRPLLTGGEGGEGMRTGVKQPDDLQTTK